MNLEGRTVFVTGGSSGIGLGIARACAEAGMKVAVSYRTEEHLQQALGHFDTSKDAFHAVRLDITRREELERAAEEIEARWGPIDLLVNNAGIGFPGRILESSPEEWEYALKVNVLGVVNCLQVVVPRMGEAAHVVTVASMSGLFAAGRAGVYTTTKFAVVGMMEALAHDLLEQGIGVSICCPGIVQSRIADWKRNSPFQAEESTEPDHSVASAGMEALDYGRHVLEGVRRKALYILTHPEYREGMAQRFEALERSFARVRDRVPEERREAAQRVLKSPLYEYEIEMLQRHDRSPLPGDK